MENASKALIIAGSILISLIIISLGIVIFRNMSSSVERNANLTQEKISAFNSKITPYFGKNVSGSQVNALIQLARTINQKSINESDNVQRIEIKRNGSTIVAKDNSTVGRVETGGKYYKVEGEFDNNGLITKITVTP